MGDYNACHEFLGCMKTYPNGDQLFNLIEEHELAYLNDPKQPTFHRVCNGYKEILDFVITTKNVVQNSTECYVGEGVGSDHLPVHLKLNNRCKIDKYPAKTIRPVHKTDWLKIR